MFLISISYVDTTLASERSRKVCAKRLEDQSIRKGYYAFAMSADEEHCGWSWGKEAKKYAEISAIRSCKKFKGASCKVVHSGCKPFRTNTCKK
ncbi:DUF4189 domain-containing protein [Roseibium sp. SCP14]|uniref:DUF4189 domain-containing protein n=1 Tax=Roseibium sp. SCP14 TaxID=3141375 RepID=UPI00333A34B7